MRISEKEILEELIDEKKNQEREKRKVKSIEMRAAINKPIEPLPTGEMC